MNRFLEICSIIGERYLDVNHSEEDIQRFERQLKELGCNRLIRWPLEIFAAGGLWWNIHAWEWLSLDFYDMVAGWELNLTVMVILFLLCWLLFSFSIGLIAIALFASYAFLIGFGLRSGSAWQRYDEE